MSQMFVPPGYRFHPTDEELVGYYLFKKLTDRTFDGNVIPELDMLQMEPWELPGFSALNDSEWYFFSPRDKKYPKGSKSNRATPRGYWKSTGRDRPFTDDIPEGFQGVKKTLVFYLGRGNLGSRTDWVMHEFRIEGREDSECKNMDSFVLCRVYNKKGNVKSLNRSRAKRYLSSCDDEHPARASKEQKLDHEESDLAKAHTQVRENASAASDPPFEFNGPDARNEHDTKSDICFDHDSGRLLDREVNSNSSPSAKPLPLQKASCDPKRDATSKTKAGSAGLEAGLRCNNAEAGCEALATSSDNLSADESVTSFQDHEIDNRHSFSRVKKESIDCKPEDVWESHAPSHFSPGVCLSAEENPKLDYSSLVCRNFSGVSYMDYFSYCSSFEEAVKRAGMKKLLEAKENEDCTLLLTPLARKADSPLAFFSEKPKSEDCAKCEVDSARVSVTSSMTDTNHTKLHPTHGSAFVKFCSAR